MPLAKSSYRFSYLQQTEYSNSTQLLEWLKLASETIEENEQTINELIAEKEELIKELTEFQEQEENKKQLLKLINKLEQKEQASEELVQINSFLQLELTNLQNQFQQQTRQVKKNNQTIQQKDQQLKTLKETLTEKEEEINSLQQRITNLNAKEKKSRLSRERLEKHLSLNYSKQAQNEIQLQKYQTQIEYLKDKNDALVQSEQQLLQTHEENSLTNQELKSDFDTIFQQLTASQENNLLLEEKIRELEEELVAKPNQEEVPNGVNENLYNDLQHNLETDLAEQKQVYQELEQKYQKLFLTTEKLKKEQIKHNEIPTSSPFWRSQKPWWIGGIVLIFFGGWWMVKKYLV